MRVLTLLWENTKSTAKSVGRFFIQYPLAAVATVVVVVVGLLLVKSGVKKDLNIGGVVKWLFSKPGTQKSVVAAANEVPKHRVDDEGKAIPVGTADENGWTQWEVKEFKPSANPLRDRTVISVPGKDGAPVEVKLPEGVKDTDVDQVVEVHPEVYVVKTNNASKVHAKDLLDRLPKPKGS